jgi:hypothetical protein
MSSLIFQVTQEEAIVVTDTLAVDSVGNAALYTSKAVYLPHLRLVIAGTGIGGFADDWATQVNGRMRTSGIDNLNTHTPARLQANWLRCTADSAMPACATTTVYHFGESEFTGQIHAYAYRSERAFTSERLPYGIGVKPKCSVPQAELLKNIPAMMQEQRAIQESRPEADRLHIGGEAIGIFLTPDTCNIFSIFRFSDYQKILREILDGRERVRC